MNRILLLALLAGAPSAWNPVWGQAPSIGIEPGSNKKNDTTLPNSQTQEHSDGTKAHPFVVDPKGHIDSPEEAAKDKAEEDHKTLIERWMLGSTIAVAAFTGILMVIGALGVGAANRTLEAIGRQEKLSGDTAQRQLRAYVCVDSAFPRFIGSGQNESFEVQIEIKNSGQTPAYGLSHWSSMQIGDPYPVDNPREAPAGVRLSSAVLAPGGRSIMANPNQEKINAPIITLGPLRPLYVYGKISYIDAFGVTRYTTYKVCYRGRRKLGDDGTIIGSFENCPDGNEAN